MPYIKLLTALTALALLTACGGGGTADKAGGDTTTDCETNAFHADCEAIESAIKLRQTMCLNDDAIHSTCGAIITSFCTENPHRTFAGVCTGDDYLPNRIADCIEGGKADSANCRQIAQNATKNTTLIACLENPFDMACESVPDFMSSFEQARMNRASFCDNSDNVANDFCTGDNVGIVCGFDPFTAICPDATYLSVRVNNCITAGNANSNNNCNTVFTESASNTCLANPFTDACASNTDFGTYANMARTNRVTFCGTNSSDTICDTLTACQNNPFATECEAYFQTERDNRVSFCDMAGNDTNARCMGASLMGVCGIDPFNTSCINNTAYLTNRQTRCVTDAIPHTSCGTVLGSIVDPTDITGITTPAGVLNHADLPATVALATADTAILSHFLSVDANGVIDSTGLNATPATLSRDGDAMDGVTYVRGTIESVTQSFVGLLPTTNLGAPLPSTTADATWEGSYYLFLNNATNDITFTIDFEEGTIDATDTQTTNKTTFDLDFTATGVITGDVRFGILGAVFDDTAEARGLIGEQGLVGGFANTDGEGTWGSGLYGGFVADNPAFDNPAVVEYNDWLAIGETVATPSSPAKNEFISGITTTGIRDGDGMLTQLGHSGLNLSDARYKGVAFGGDAADGFVPAPMSGEGTANHVGILPTTNLGAPLTQTTASAVWQGVLSVFHTLRTEVGSFTPTIDFTAKTMTGTIADRAMDDTDFAVLDGNVFPTGVAYSFTASFNNPHGQLTGTITRTGTIDSVEVVSAGTIRGIIGEEGAVAGFISDADEALSYTGGFVARPTPSE